MPDAMAPHVGVANLFPVAPGFSRTRRPGRTVSTVKLRGVGWMGVVNRCAVGVRGREPLLRWAEQLDPAGLEEFGAEPTLYLIPEFDTDDEQEELLREAYEVIFEQELQSWSSDPSLWPQERSYELFRDWFDVVIYPVIDDLVDDELRNELTDEEQALIEEAHQRIRREAGGQGFGGGL